MRRKTIVSLFLMLLLISSVTLLSSCGNDYEKRNIVSIEELETGRLNGYLYQWLKITNNGKEEFDYFSADFYELDSSGNKIKMDYQLFDDFEDATSCGDYVYLEPGKSAYVIIEASSTKTVKFDYFQYEYSTDDKSGYKNYTINPSDETAVVDSTGIEIKIEPDFDEWNLFDVETNFSNGAIHSVKITSKADFPVWDFYANYALYNKEGDYIGSSSVSCYDKKFTKGQSGSAEIDYTRIYGKATSAKLVKYQYTGEFDIDGNESNLAEVDFFKNKINAMQIIASE